MTFPAVPQQVQLQFDITGNGSFTDFTRLSNTSKLLADGKEGVTIVSGRRSEGGRIPPLLVTLDYQDNDALLNDTNGESPYYRKLVEYTPMLILADGDIRAYVELASITVKEINNDNVVLTIEGAGIKRRYGSGIWEKPLRSCAYRALSSVDNIATRVFYAPLEESAGATKVEVFDGQGAMALGGTITFGGVTDAASTERMALFGSGGTLFAAIPAYTSTMHKVCMLWKFPTPSLPANTVLVRMYCTGGNVDFIDLQYAASGDGSLILNAYKSGILVDNANSVGWGSNIIGKHVFISLEFTQNGANLDTTVLITTDIYGNLNSDPLTGVTIGRINFISLALTDCTGAAVGQLIVGNDTGAFANYISSVGFSPEPVIGIRGFTNETADDRIYRICQEEGVPITIHSSSQYGGGDGTLLGPQPVKPFLELLELSAETDGGIFDQESTVPGFVYWTRRWLYNQAPQIDATYGALVPPLLPVKDDRGRQNIVTAVNTNGTTQRYTIPDGDYMHYSAESPPLGMGVVEGKIDLNLYDDEETILQAAWRAHHGSWRGTRIPSMTYQLARSAISGDSYLFSKFTFLVPGNTILQGTLGATKWVPPGDMLMMLQGYREKLAQFSREFSVNTTPGDSWEIKVPDANASLLGNSIDANDTDIYVDPGELGPAWTLNDRFYIQIDGDVCRVETTFDSTPAFIAAGAATSGNNAAVTPALPAGITPDVGQSLFIWAAIRNSGTGVPDDETGWTTIATSGNCKLYHRYYVTGDTAPQITFTGGVANADTQAQMFAFSGLSKSLASGTKPLPVVSAQLNGSAQNVAYAAMPLARSGVAMIFAWKQDDATGYAAPAGYTEMADASATAGDDSSIAAYYRLTGAALTAGSIVVTGGAAAISRSIALAFRPTQLFLVDRNVAGNAVAHTAGAEIHAWRQGVTGL